MPRGFAAGSGIAAGCEVEVIPKMFFQVVLSSLSLEQEPLSKFVSDGRGIFMRGHASGIPHRSLSRLAICVGVSGLLALLIGGAPFESREAMALTPVGTAAHNADAELNKCGSNTGTALYGCVANVLNNLCYQIGRSAIPPGIKQPFDGAVSRLRRAVDKVQALSALAQARAVISGALQQARSIGHVEGGTADAQDLAAISAVLGHAVQLVQSKG
jgi:hypothetical protein